MENHMSDQISDVKSDGKSDVRRTPDGKSELGSEKAVLSDVTNTASIFTNTASDFTNTASDFTNTASIFTNTARDTLTKELGASSQTNKVWVPIRN
jgi:hypothetical protein